MRVQIDDGETFTTAEIRDANPGDLDVSAALDRLEAGEDVVEVNLGAGGVTIFRRVLPPLELVPCDDMTPEPLPPPEPPSAPVQLRLGFDLGPLFDYCAAGA